MPIAYDPKDPVKTMLAANIKRTVNTRSYYGTLFMFCILRVTVSVGMSADAAKKLDTMLTYPMSLVGTLFTFLIGFFMNNCYTRFMDNWHAAMIGWSRMNDLALQVYAYVRDRTQACDVMRLMNLANHLCYGDLSSQDLLDVCVRRHLATPEEAERLRPLPAGTRFFLAGSWALERLADQSVKNPVDEVFCIRMDLSVIEWRQQTTLLPMIQMNPLPWPYFRNMLTLRLLFEVVLALKIAFAGFTADTWVLKAYAMLLDLLLYAAITLIVHSLFNTSATLLMPWCADDEDGATVDLPAEYFVALPLGQHRALYSEFAADASNTSIFLRPLERVDADLLAKFGDTDSGALKKILAKHMRSCAPQDDRGAAAYGRHGSAVDVAAAEEAKQLVH